MQDYCRERENGGVLLAWGLEAGRTWQDYTQEVLARVSAWASKKIRGADLTRKIRDFPVLRGVLVDCQQEKWLVRWRAGELYLLGRFRKRRFFFFTCLKPQGGDDPWAPLSLAMGVTVQGNPETWLDWINFYQRGPQQKEAEAFVRWARKKSAVSDKK